MERSFSAGAIVFRREGGQIYYLFLIHERRGKRKGEYLNYPKGLYEEGENAQQAARREIEEETGLKDLAFVSGFKTSEKLFYRWEGKPVFKIVTVLLAETKTKEVKTSFEHKGYVWLTFEEAMQKLAFKNIKQTLASVHEFLQSCLAGEYRKPA